MKKTGKHSKEDKGQSSIFDFGEEYLTGEEKKQFLESQIQYISHEKHIADSKLIKETETKNSKVLSDSFRPQSSRQFRNRYIKNCIKQISRINNHNIDN